MAAEGTQNGAAALTSAEGHALTTDLEHAVDVPQISFLGTVNARGLRFLRFLSVAVADDSLDHLDGIAAGLARYRGEGGLDHRFLDFSDGVASVQLRRGGVLIYAAADSDGRATELVALIAAKLRPDEQPDDELAVAFWSATQSGGRSVQRSISTPLWSELAGNHSAATRSALERLLAVSEPDSGRLILWHGAPGTGKTYALRALARAWSAWSAPHFITDPDELLGGKTGYLLDVLTASDPDREGSRSWRLLILEDAGELLAADARERTGQALSRLLNVTDGLLGQGMNALVLVTTNEPLGQLHPAVIRPGRCLAEIEFEPLTAREANAWLKYQGSELRVSRPTPVADLYALLAGGDPPKEREPFGFAAA